MSLEGRGLSKFLSNEKLNEMNKKKYRQNKPTKVEFYLGLIVIICLLPTVHFTDTLWNTS